MGQTELMRCLMPMSRRWYLFNTMPKMAAQAASIPFLPLHALLDSMITALK